MIRHGQTEWNVAGRMQGRLDSPLTDVGKSQAGAHGKVLGEAAAIQELYVSPSGRTRETASIVNSHVRAPMYFEDALMERDCGEWSGQTLSEIESAFPESWAARDDDPYGHRPPGGENLDDMTTRVRSFLLMLVDRNVEEVGLVTHGVMSRVILAHFLGLSRVEAIQVRHPNDIFYRLEFAADGAVSGSYFQAGDGPIGGLLRRSESGTILRPAR